MRWMLPWFSGLAATCRCAILGAASVLGFGRCVSLRYPSSTPLCASPSFVFLFFFCFSFDGTVCAWWGDFQCYRSIEEWRLLLRSGCFVGYVHVTCVYVWVYPKRCVVRFGVHVHTNTCITVKTCCNVFWFYVLSFLVPWRFPTGIYFCRVPIWIIWLSFFLRSMCNLCKIMASIF